MLQKGKLYRLVGCTWSEKYLILFASAFAPPGTSERGKIEINQCFTVLDDDKDSFVKVLTADGIGYIRNLPSKYTVVECR